MRSLVDGVGQQLERVHHLNVSAFLFPDQGSDHCNNTMHLVNKRAFEGAFNQGTTQGITGVAFPVVQRKKFQGEPRSRNSNSERREKLTYSDSDSNSEVGVGNGVEGGGWWGYSPRSMLE